MKCIYCQNDAKYKDRQDGHCPKCHRRFAFEPQKGDKLTDFALKTAIDRVSSGGTVKWTRDHLYHEVARRTSKSWTWSIVLGVLGAGAAIVELSSSGSLVLMTVLWTLALFKVPTQKDRLTPELFRLLLERWIAAHGQPPGLIVRKELPGAEARRALPSDIEEYSFDRAVISDRPETVDLLLANNFHFENNCAILSIDGYPPQVSGTVRAMLKKNPKLVVYALHDATVEGCLLAHRLVSSQDWFKGSARVIDVGLSPGHATHFKGSVRRQEGVICPSPLLSDADNKWLSRYFLELSVIPPEQLIKRLFRAMSTGAQEPQAGGEGAIYYIHAGTLSTDASASDGGGDSFG